MAACKKQKKLLLEVRSSTALTDVVQSAVQSADGGEEADLDEKL